MDIKKNGKIFIGIFSTLFIIITVIAATIESNTTLEFSVRIFALWGFYFILIASIMTPFLKEIYKYFGAPFLKIHHFLAIAGIIFATLHPVTFAIQVADARVFYINTESWLRFWELAGRPAVYVLYISVLGAVLRKKLKNSWRKIHMLIYIVLIFLIAHGNLIGTDFTNIGISLIFNGLFIISMIAMIYKQHQKLQRKKTREKKAQAKSQNE